MKCFHGYSKAEIFICYFFHEYEISLKQIEGTFLQNVYTVDQTSWLCIFLLFAFEQYLK